MGSYQGNGFALVSMTNKDVYYVSIADGKKILLLLSHPPVNNFFETVDIKQHTTVSIAIQHVSSVVVKEGSYRG